MDTFRTFIAIELPRELRARVTEHIDRLRREAPDVRASWSRKDNLHLTLKFLGNVPMADIPRVSDAVEHASKTISPFDLVLSECGSFPAHGRPSVLWIGGSAGRGPQAGSPLGVLDILPASSDRSEASSLRSLHQRIEEKLSAADFPRETRPFHPHLTIARLRRSQGTRNLADLHKRLGFAPGAFTVSELVVFRSELRKEGSKHTAISRHELR